VSRLVAVHNPHPGGTYIWFTVPDEPEPLPDPLSKPEPETTVTQPDAYWEEAHAAFRHCAAEDARIWAEADPEPAAALSCCPELTAPEPDLEIEPW
jgi:hypothetical protein